ncbi:MAG TPA: nitroreductase/quinone reductase family protein [Mycobacterium sp.]|jgi:deazaflavin-dependent oxidoreductase (nitroreductase family)|nr:nitroreductase/quinone reductase family protein [Mycobacterium sp.]
MSETYVPSPSEQVRNQVARYEASNGADGGTLEGKPVVILTTTGARTGAVRKNPVMRIPYGDKYIAVASAAGAATDPAWYRNLTAHPDLWVQDGAVKRQLRACEVFGEEKTRMWAVAEQYWPHFPEYRAKAGDREIPVLVLEPVGHEET